MSSPYREEAQVSAPVPTVTPERLAYLERCEAILEVLDERAAWVSVDGHRRRRWNVSIDTGEAVDVYPAWAEGEGTTLAEAMEEAMGWPPVNPSRPKQEKQEMRRKTSTFWTGLLLGAALYLMTWAWWA